jgi:hypothetical protein
LPTLLDTRVWRHVWPGRQVQCGPYRPICVALQHSKRRHSAREGNARGQAKRCAKSQSGGTPIRPVPVSLPSYPTTITQCAYVSWKRKSQQVKQVIGEGRVKQEQRNTSLKYCNPAKHASVQHIKVVAPRPGTRFSPAPAPLGPLLHIGVFLVSQNAHILSGSILDGKAKPGEKQEGGVP